MRYKPAHFGMAVSDMERALRFYCDGLGFEQVAGFEMTSETAPGMDAALGVDAPLDVATRIIVHGTMAVELMQWRTRGDQPPPVRRHGLSPHLSFFVDDVDAAALELVALGATVIEGTRQSVGTDFVYLADPEGTPLELVQRTARRPG